MDGTQVHCIASTLVLLQASGHLWLQDFFHASPLVPTPSVVRWDELRMSNWITARHTLCWGTWTAASRLLINKYLVLSTMHVEKRFLNTMLLFKINCKFSQHMNILGLSVLASLLGFHSSWWSYSVWWCTAVDGNAWYHHWQFLSHSGFCPHDGWSFVPRTQDQEWEFTSQITNTGRSCLSSCFVYSAPC